jgi:hypothetical protein
MRLTASVGTVVVLLLCARLSSAQDAKKSQPCSAAIRDALLIALRYSVADVPIDYAPTVIDRRSPAIPDYNVLPSAGPILVRANLDDPNCILEASVLPKPANRTFLLVDDEHIRRRARRHENGVTYVSAYRVRFGADEVIVSLGTALRLAPGDKRGLVCCCGGEMVLRRVDGEWLFIEWRNITCA